MSEYWLSKKKYYCQYCEIYIADDAPSRAQHENGLRHKGNKDRFIRGLYKAGVKKKQESEEEKREMKRVEQAAQEAYARDIGAGHATPGASSSSAPALALAPAPKPKPPPPKPSDPYTNYTTAASLGFTDPDVDRLGAEAEVRKNEGRAGDWVAVVPPPPPFQENGEASTANVVKLESGASTGEVRKREEEPVDDDDTRQFKMRKRTVAVGLGEIYDPGVIRVKPRVDPNVKPEAASITLSSSEPVQGPALGGDAPQAGAKGKADDAGPKATERPAWTRREWKWAGEDGDTDATSAVAQSNGTSVNGESHLDALKGVYPPSGEAAAVAAKSKGDIHRSEPTSVPKMEESEVIPGGSLAGGLFRKRKPPAGASTKGRRRD